MNRTDVVRPMSLCVPALTNTRYSAWKWQSLSLLSPSRQDSICNPEEFYLVFCSNRLRQGGIIFWLWGGCLWIMKTSKRQNFMPYWRNRKPDLASWRPCVQFSEHCTFPMHLNLNPAQDRVQWRDLVNTRIKFRSVRSTSWTAAPSAVKGLFFMDLTQYSIHVCNRKFSRC
jgi:hypothetical protein